MASDHGIAEDAPFTTDSVPARSMTPVPNAAEPATADGERNLVFPNLVREDGDIVGLVAYSIYKQNKLDWLQAFERVKGRAPEPAEQSAYIIGESTPRRLATYRHLADATLMGQGPDTGAEHGAGRSRFGSLRAAGAASWMGPSLIAYAVLAIIVLVGFYLAFHFTGRP